MAHFPRKPDKRLRGMLLPSLKLSKNIKMPNAIVTVKVVAGAAALIIVSCGGWQWTWSSAAAAAAAATAYL